MEAYLTSTFAPASSSFFFIVSESALETASLTVEGVPATVKEGIGKADVDNIKKKLEDAGAKVEVK